MPDIDRNTIIIKMIAKKKKKEKVTKSNRRTVQVVMTDYSVSQEHMMIYGDRPFGFRWKIDSCIIIVPMANCIRF